MPSVAQLEQASRRTRSAKQYAEWEDLSVVLF